jgi:hypothetical protein
VELPDVLLEEITGVANAGQVSGSDERRRYSRLSFGSRAYVYPLIQSEHTRGLTAVVRDISVGGIGLLLSREVSSGDEFVLRLPRKAAGPAIDVMCLVRRCEPGGFGGGNFVVGATFELVLDLAAPDPMTIKPPESCALPAALPEPAALADETGPSFSLGGFFTRLIARVQPIRERYRVRKRLSAKPSRRWGGRARSRHLEEAFRAGMAVAPEL